MCWVRFQFHPRAHSLIEAITRGWSSCHFLSTSRLYARPAADSQNTPRECNVVVIVVVFFSYYCTLGSHPVRRSYLVTKPGIGCPSSLSCEYRRSDCWCRPSHFSEACSFATDTLCNVCLFLSFLVVSGRRYADDAKGTAFTRQGINMYSITK